MDKQLLTGVVVGGLALAAIYLLTTKEKCDCGKTLVKEVSPELPEKQQTEVRGGFQGMPNFGKPLFITNKF